MKEKKLAISGKTPVKSTTRSVPGAKKVKRTQSKLPEAQSLEKKPAAEPAEAPVLKAKVTRRKPTATIPALLLEGDAPAQPTPGGAGQRYVLGPTPPPEHFQSIEEQLPEAYGTQQLFLTARDPHWLYAAWDFTREQLLHYNTLSADRHLVLRIFRGIIEGEPISIIHVHPESRNWFVPVAEAATKYMAELGYYTRAGRWTRLAQSAATLTPPDSISAETTASFATIPAEVPFSHLLALIKTVVKEHVPLVEALQQLRAQGFQNLPGTPPLPGEWTPAQEQALAQVVSMDKVRRVWIGSLEVTELVRRQLEQQAWSISAAQLGLPGSPGAFGAISSISSVSSPFGAMEKRRGFWFNVNAELIIYGATDPQASVTVAGRPVRLRSDGSFSFRFALPDGDYQLPAVAVSPDREETRSADLQFRRHTQYQGEVTAHPQDPQLKAPVAAAIG